MKHWIFGSLLLSACSGLQAAGPAGGNADIAQFIKDNGRFVSRLNADVTGEGVPDAIIVLANDKTFTVTVTVLMQLNGKTADGKGTLKGFQGADSLTLELSPLGPPTCRVANGVLIIDSTVGGNTVRTAATYRYRFDADEGRMQLIGLDAERTSSTFGAKLSWNALTGTHVFRSGPREGQTIRYGPEIRTTYKLGTVYMSLEPKPDELLDRALEQKKKR
jgi:hypothetical protein